MANEKNLIPANKRSLSEARENGRKGGLKSGEARRKKKSMKQAMNLLLSLPVSDEYKEAIERYGLDEKDADNQMVIIISAFEKAASGNVDAMKFIAGITGSNSMSENDRKKAKLSEKRLKLQNDEFEYKKKQDENNRW